MQTRVMRKLFQTGKYSYVVTLPKNLITTLGWNQGQLLEVDFNRKKKHIIIKKYKF